MVDPFERLSPYDPQRIGYALLDKTTHFIQFRLLGDEWRRNREPGGVDAQNDAVIQGRLLQGSPQLGKRFHCPGILDELNSQQNPFPANLPHHAELLQAAKPVITSS